MASNDPWGTFALQDSGDEYHANSELPHATSMAGLVKDNWGTLATIGILSALARANGRNSAGQVIGGAGLDALGALGGMGSFAQKHDQQVAKRREDQRQRDIANDLAERNYDLSKARLDWDKQYNGAMLGINLNKERREAADWQREQDAWRMLSGGAMTGASPASGQGWSQPTSSSDPYSLFTGRESNNNPADVSTDSSNSKSYGLYQFNTGANHSGGTAHKFVSYLSQAAPDLYQALGGATPGSAQFDAAWKALGSGQSAQRFAAAQRQFFEGEYVAPAMKNLRGSGIERFASNPVIKAVIASTATQHGPQGANGIIRDALRGVNPNLPEQQQLEQLVTNIYDQRGMPGRFKTAEAENPGITERLRNNRFEPEKADALRLLRQGVGPQAAQQGATGAWPGTMPVSAGNGQHTGRNLAEPPQITQYRQLLLSPEFRASKAGQAVAASVKSYDDYMKAVNKENGKPSDLTGVMEKYRLETKQYSTQVNALADMVTTFEDGHSPMGDVMLGYNFIKVQDPESVVRESEMLLASRAISVPDMMKLMVEKYLGGTRFTPEQRRDMLAKSVARVDSALSRWREIDSTYTDIANTYGLNPNHIVRSGMYAGLPAKARKFLEGNSDPNKGKASAGGEFNGDMYF